MKLTENIVIYDSLLEPMVEYINEGWDKHYKVEDVCGIDWGKGFLFVHCNKERFNKEAYPVKFTLNLNKC